MKHVAGRLITLVRVAIAGAFFRIFVSALHMRKAMSCSVICSFFLAIAILGSLGPTAYSQTRSTATTSPTLQDTIGWMTDFFQMHGCSASSADRWGSRWVQTGRYNTDGYLQHEYQRWSWRSCTRISTSKGCVISFQSDETFNAPPGFNPQHGASQNPNPATYMIDLSEFDLTLTKLNPPQTPGGSQDHPDKPVDSPNRVEMIRRSDNTVFNMYVDTRENAARLLSAINHALGFCAGKSLF